MKHSVGMTIGGRNAKMGKATGFLEYRRGKIATLRRLAAGSRAKHYNEFVIPRRTRR